MEVDFIIVGHGIAGINIAHQLELAQQTFVVLNEEKKHTSSKIAAGLYNPITGRKMKHTWKADSLFPFLQETYHQIEEKIGGKYLYDQNIYRPFRNIEEQNEWLSEESLGDEFIERVYTKSQFPAFIKDEFGGIMLKQSGFLDIPNLIEQHKIYLMKKGIYQNEVFKSDKLIQRSNKLFYGDIEAKHIIFCEGPLAQNEFFQWVPTAAVKGEILHIIPESPLPEGVIFNRGVFIVKNPAHEYYRVGSTYHWKDLDWQATEEAKVQLEERLASLLRINYKIVGQEAGIRPASKDRRPLIGHHPKFENILLFNGLGTKGVSLAPYFAKNLINHLILGSKIADEVNINRYYSLY